MEDLMRSASLRFVTVSLFGSALFAPAISVAKLPSPAPAPVTCTALGSGLTGGTGIKSAESHLVAAAGANVAYCQVNILYGEIPDQNINVRVGLPLNSVDGGTGGVQGGGAWNGRTQGIGGGGCSGSLAVNSPVNTRYVGSGSDAGHSGGDCEPGVNTDGTYNLQFINDFIRNGMKQQILLSKAVTETYYAMKPAYNYWNGCSTGGRQGYVLAQELPTELDGILANAPAIYWTRFQTAQMWGQIAMKDFVGGPIAAAKLNQATASAVAACDAADGVTDGVIDDPRTCSFSAMANVCGTSTAPVNNCLTAPEALAIDKIWDGPRNAQGTKVWFGLDRGTSLTGLNGTNPFALGVTQFHWDEHDRTFDWKTVTVDEYPDVAEDGSRNIADVTDTFGDLKEYEKSGGKLLTLVGGNDQLIFPRGVIKYYREMATRGHKSDFEKQQEFYRLFRTPGAGHCAVPNAFPQLVNWVENGVAPEQIINSTTVGGVPRTRLLCAYPQAAIYNGTGDTNDAANFHCGGNLETTATVCADTLAQYKDEADGKPDYKDTNVKKHDCEGGPEEAEEADGN
jgi:hypothetical protein